MLTDRGLPYSEAARIVVVIMGALYRRVSRARTRIPAAQAAGQPL